MNKSNHYLASAWNSYTQLSIKFGTGSPEAELIWWAFEEMELLVSYKPFSALEVIVEVLRITDDDGVLCNLAAGPLESLLVKHASEVANKVIELATSDEDFYKLLQGVWGDNIDDTVWQRIESLYK